MYCEFLFFSDFLLPLLVTITSEYSERGGGLGFTMETGRVEPYGLGAMIGFVVVGVVLPLVAI